MSVRDRVATYFRKFPRHPVHRALCAASFAVAFAFACSQDSPGDLDTRYLGEQRIAGDAPSSFSLQLDPGAYLIDIRELDIDVRAIIDAPGVHTELEDRVPRHGLIAHLVSLPNGGTLRVALHSIEHRGRRGTARLRVGRWRRAAGEPEGPREQGFAASGLALEQTALDDRAAWTRAADLLHESIAKFATAHDDASRAQAEYSLAYLEYQSRMEWQPSIRAAERAREIYEAIDDLIGVQNAATIRATAELEVASGMSAGAQRAEQHALYAAADKSLALAAEKFLRSKLDIRAQYAINMRGIRAFYQGQYEEAEGYFQQAADLARGNQDPGEESRALANLAWMHNRLGLVVQAASEYERLLPLIEKDRQSDVYLTTLGNLGLCLVALGNFDRAIALHTEAITLAVQVHNDSEHARHLELLGELYFRTGDVRRALDTLRAALDIQERLEDTRARVSTLRIAGNAASALEQHDLALDYLRRSVGLDVNPHSSARTRVLIASELRVLGDLRGADAELKRAAASTNPLARASVIAERGRLRYAQRRYTAAIEDLRAADAQLAALSLDFNRIDVNTALAQALLANREVEAAGVAADAAVNIVRNIRVKSANPEWRAHFLSARYSPYEARIAVDFATADPQAAWRAFRTAEEIRARSLADELADGGARGAAGDPEGDALRARLTAQQLRLETRMQRQDIDDKGVQELRRALVETRARIDAHRLRVERIAANGSSITSTLAELQRRLPADTAVLAYFVGDDASHAWLLTRARLDHVQLPGRVAMQRLTAGVVGTRMSGEDGGAHERALSSDLFGHLLDGVTEKRLLIIPDGPLNGVPFAALLLPGDDGHGSMLVDRFVIGYAPSLTLAFQNAPRTGAPATRVAVVSDPVYAADDMRLADGRPAGVLRGPPLPSPRRLTRLRYSGLEARTVARAMGDEHTLRLDGFDASLDRVLELSRQNLAVLHFATHAAARRDLPDQSALYLSEYSRDGQLLEDSQLTAGRIARSGLRADVVVLSGCATGDGGELRGEGVLGLTYGFLANGSRSVVAALWPIEDASTARFMNEFYRAYRDSGQAAEALRDAQLRTRASTKAAVWSSFVVRANGFP